MTITPQNIKLLKAEVQTDTDDGGGLATSLEVVDGVSNNLFPDIPESSRVYGKLEFRKIYPAVLTNDTDVLFGAQFLFTDIPDDEKVNVCAFTTNSWNDVRKSAQSMLENYLAAGTLGAWEVLEKQLIGQRAVLLMSDPTATPPAVGQSLLLIQNEGRPDEFYQYVRVSKVTSETRTFYRSASDTFTLRVHTCEITDPLTREFTGWTPQEFRNGSVSTISGRCRMRETRIADAAKYYSAKRLTRAVNKGEATIQVDSIYTNLLPSTESETPLAGLGVSGSFTGLTTGSPNNGYTAYISVGGSGYASTVSVLGTAIAPDTFSITLGNQTVIKDNGMGMLFRGTTHVGTIQYDSGMIQWIPEVFGYAGDVTISYASAFVGTQYDQSDFIEVTELNNGRVWVLNLNPVPVKGSLRITYINAGKRYSLFDNGDGSLGGVTSGVGVGVVDYETGTATVTLAAYPDVGSYILYQWGDRLVKIDATSRQNRFPHLILNVNDMVGLFDGFYKLQTDPTLKWTVRIGTNNIQKTAYINRQTLKVYGDASGEITKDYAKISPINPIPLNTEITLSATSVGGGGSFNKTVPFTSVMENAVIDLSSITDDLNPWSIKLRITAPLKADSYAYVRAYDRETKKTELTGLSLYISGYDTNSNLYQVSCMPVQHVPSQVVGTFNLATKRMEVQLSVNYYMYMAEVVKPNWSFSSYTYTKFNRITQTAKVDSDQSGNTTVSYTSNVSSAVVENRVVNTVGYGLEVIPVDGYELDPSAVSFVMSKTKVVLGGGGKARSLSITGTYMDVGTYTLESDGKIKIVIDGISMDSNLDRLITFTSVGLRVQGTPKNKFAFYTPIAPIRSGTFQLRVKTNAGNKEATATNAGVISGDGIQGRIDFKTGFVAFAIEHQYRNINVTDAQTIFNTAPYLGSNVQTYSRYVSKGNGVYNLYMPVWAYSEDITYNAVGLTYLPLSKDILGIDPVRLPADGRVPCFRTADMIVITEPKTQEITTPVAGATFSVSDTRLSTFKIVDAANTLVTKYVVNMSSGAGAFAEDFTTDGLILPLTIEYSVQDLCLVQDVQVNGTIALNKVLAHDYSEGCLVSSVVFLKDLQARAYNKFHQAAWLSHWLDGREGQGISANYNQVFYPFVVSNDGAVKERWAIIFTSNSTFKCIGEFVGELVQQGAISEDYAPINPMTMKPYFKIRKEGWGAGWANGYVMRFNTDAANYPIWVVRTILQGQSTDEKQNFTMQLRGDIDNEEP